MEKNPDAKSSPARAAKRLLKGISSKPVERLRQCGQYLAARRPCQEIRAALGSLASENHLEHELAAHVGDNQQPRAGEDPVKRRAAAPAVAMATEKQRAEYDPAEQREHDLVREPQ